MGLYISFGETEQNDLCVLCSCLNFFLRFTQLLAMPRICIIGESSRLAFPTRERERQAGRQTETQMHKDRDKQTDRKTETEKDTDRQRQIETEINRQT